MPHRLKREYTKEETPFRSSSVFVSLRQAISIQLMAFLFIGILTAGIRTAWFSDSLILACMQGVLAAVLCLFSRRPIWWVPLHALFAPALIVGLSFHLPSWIYLLCLLILAVIYWGVFKTRVPLYLSSPAVWDAVISCLPVGRPFRFLDIGSGLGGLVCQVAQKNPDARCEGVEIAPLPWLFSRIRQYFVHGQCRFLYADYNKMPLADYEVVFAFLSPVVMPDIWQKVCREMRPGSLFLSYSFIVPDTSPDIELPAGNAVLYGWYISGAESSQEERGYS